MNELEILASVRKRNIRLKIQALLQNQTEAKERVYINRVIPTQSEDLPVILIYTTGESISRFNEAPKDYRRVMSVRIECIDKGNTDDDLDFKLETLADKVEEVMEIDDTLGDLVNKSELVSTDYQADPDAESPTGILALTYSVEFFTDAIQPGKDSLPAFTGADVNYNVGIDTGSPADNVPDTLDVAIT